MTQNNKRIASNFSWVIIGNIARMIVSLAVGVLSARYLQPENYGNLNYVISFSSFFTTFCTLGINSVLIKVLMDHKEEQGKVLGSALFMRSLSTFACMIVNVILVIVLNPNEQQLWLMSAIHVVYLLFNIADSIKYWFQARLEAKYPAIISFISYVIMAGFKIILLGTKKSVVWFAFSMPLDAAVVAILLLVAYWKKKGERFSVSRSMCQEIFSQSKHFILAGLMVSLYAQIDKIMIKGMVDAESVAYYTAANSINSMWTFVIAAIIETATPVVMQVYNTNKERFETMLKTTYCIVLWLCIGAGVVITVLANLIVNILYGQAYEASAMLLKILVWSQLFSQIGVAKNIWIVCEKKSKHLIVFTICGAIGNVILNVLLIPFYGAVGAAVATVITQMITAFIVQFIIKDTRRNVILIMESLIFKGVNLQAIFKMLLQRKRNKS